MNKPNPFNPNTVVSPSLFAGREKQVSHILGRLVHTKEKLPSCFIVHGERGMGKTSLARFIMNVASSGDPEFNLNFISTYYAVEKMQDFRSVMLSMFNLITDRLPSQVINRLEERLGGVFSDGKFSFGAFKSEQNESKDDGGIDSFIKDQSISVLTNILVGLNEASGDLKKDRKKKGLGGIDGLLFVIDDIHNLDRLSEVAPLLRSILTTLEVNDLGNISFLLLGNSYEILSDFYEADPASKLNFDTMALNYMSPDEARNLLEKAFHFSGVKYDDQALSAISHLTEGYPHTLQMLGYEVVNCDEDNNVNEDDWNNAWKETAKSLQLKDFTKLYHFSGSPILRDQILNVLAISGKPLSKQNLKKFFNEANIYQKSCLGTLKALNAVKEHPENKGLMLKSSLFRSAILFHIAPNMKTDPVLVKAVENFNKLNTL